MIIAIDYDGSIVKDTSWPGLEQRPELRDGAAEGLASLKRAGHVLLLYSARANRALTHDPDLNPLIRAGVLRLDRAAWDRARPVHEQRLHQMIDFVQAELPQIFDAIDLGHQGKPVADLYLDDRSRKLGDEAYMAGVWSWAEIASVFGA